MSKKLQQLFQSADSLEELTELINLAFKLRSEKKGQRFWAFSSWQLMAMMDKPRKHYRSFTIKKKSGGNRMIQAPVVSLKMVQWAIALVVDSVSDVHPNSHGFVTGKNVKTNARVHLMNRCVVNVDLEDFFHSISSQKVYRALVKSGASKYMAMSLMKLCCVDKRLPQGSPASPALTNLVFSRVDRRLTGLIGKFNCAYSRYVDDITISGSGRALLETVLPRVETILNSEGFRLNDEKTRWQWVGQRQEVTGLVLSHGDSGVIPGVNSPRLQRRKVRAMLFHWKENGVIAAARNSGFKGPDGHLSFVRHVQGKLAYMSYVNRTDEVRRMERCFKQLLRNGGVSVSCL